MPAGRLVLATALYFSMHFVFAQDTISVSSSQIVDISSRLTYFVDTTRLASPAEILQHHTENKFQYAPHVMNLTGTTGDIWCRIVVKNPLNEPAYVQLAMRWVDDVAIYQQRNDTLREVFSGRGEKSYTQLMFFSRPTFPLDVLPNTPAVIFVKIRMQRDAHIFLRMNLGNLKQVASSSRVIEFLSVAIFGIMFVMLFYNLCLAIVVREFLYVKYSIYISASILCMVWLTGFTVEGLWLKTPAQNHAHWPMGLFYFTQLFFINDLLQVKQKLRTVWYASWFIYAGAGAIMLPMLHPTWVVVSLLTVALLLPAYLLLASCSLLIKKDRMAAVFLLGWIPLLATTVLNVLMTMDLIRYHWAFDLPSIEVSLAWELVIFSLALGYRYNIMKREKLETQATNVRMVHEQESLLRRMVFEQTEEIMAQNDQLLRNQEEIQQQNEQLESQNQAYARLKEMILEQNHQLEAAVQKRTLQLAQINEELKKHFHQLEQFSFIAAHNLRAPVARILGLASILNLSDPSHLENKQVLQKLVLSAQDLDMIIHDLGAILDAQRNTIEKIEPVELDTLFQKVILRFEKEIEQHGITVDVQLRANHVIAVPAYIDSIISNLISNSIKYRRELCNPEIVIRTDEDDAKVIIEVEDNGLGFDSKQFSNKLFEPFQRFHTHGDGKGLGMFLVKTQVTAMKGTIELNSEVNRGTKVVISIPKPHVLEFFAG